VQTTTRFRTNSINMHTPSPFKIMWGRWSGCADLTPSMLQCLTVRSPLWT